MRPPTCGPCNASPTQRALGRSASNRPNTAEGAPSGRGRFSPSAAKCRCKVRGEGAHPACAASTTATCAAVRPGVSRLSPTASSSTSGGVCAANRRGAGTSAANPPARYARIQRSRLARLTRTGSGENGPGWIRAATARTSRPRCLVDNPSFNASWMRP